VARLTAAYYFPNGKYDDALASSKLHLSTDGPFPFKTVKLNGKILRPEDDVSLWCRN